MPNTNEYHLYIHPQAEENDDPVAGGKSDMKDNSGGGWNDKWDGKIESAMKKLVSYSAIKGTATQVINYRISQVNLSTGQAEFQQRLEQVSGFASQGLGLAESAVIGFAAGGPVLAALAVIPQLISFGIETYQKYETLNRERQLEGISLGLAAERAGINGRRGRNQ